MRRNIQIFISILLAASIAVFSIGCANTPKSKDDPEEETRVTTASQDDTTAPAESEDETAPTDAEPEETTQGEPDSSDHELIQLPSTLEEGPDAGQAYQDKIIFVGDSTTHHLRNREVLTGGKNTTQVWTPTSGTLTLSYALTAKILYPETNTEMTIMDAAGMKQPEIMVITLGMNGISFMDENSFKTVYKTLIQEILKQSPNTKIILQSIYPRALGGNENYASITQDMINTGNIWVSDLAKECNVYYLDTQTVLKDENGYLRAEYSVGDGIHISREGYQVILQYIRTHPIPGIS